MKIVFAILVSLTAVAALVQKAAVADVAAEQVALPEDLMIGQCVSCLVNDVTKNKCFCPNNSVLQMRKYPCGPAASCAGWCCQPVNKCKLCTKPGDPTPDASCTCDAPLVRNYINIMCIPPGYCCGTQQPSGPIDILLAEA
jgi:hypothetical protein